VVKGVLETIDTLQVIVRAFVCAIFIKYFKIAWYSQKIWYK